MNILKVQIAEVGGKEFLLEEAGFTRHKQIICNCDVASYEHTHDDDYFSWEINVEGEEIFDADEL